MAIDLGFIEKCESWQLESRFFPSKVGGKPAWLDLKNIPDKKDLECQYCQNPCIFLCQVYAPYEEDDDAFHRTIYVFICKNVECCRANENGNVNVFRSQLKRVNVFYPFDPPIEQEDWRPDITVDHWAKTCYICGILAPNHCSKCKTTHYCCRMHQVYDWKHGHKYSCGNNVPLEKNEFMFPEYELVTEAEETIEDEKDDELLRGEKEMRKFKALKQNGEAGTMLQESDAELEKMANEEDEVFSEFRSKIDKYPDQVLRYNRGGQILYISSMHQLQILPKCSDCGSERQFEFQIMPQLLNYLGLKNPLECIDWGILAVFTCKRSCVPKRGYVKEFIWKQDIDNNVIVEA